PCRRRGRGACWAAHCYRTGGACRVRGGADLDRRRQACRPKEPLDHPRRFDLAGLAAGPRGDERRLFWNRGGTASVIRCRRWGLLTSGAVEDTLGRFRGYGIVGLLEETEEATGAVPAADRVADVLRGPFELSGRSMAVSASIGVALSSRGRERASDLLRDAD